MKTTLPIAALALTAAAAPAFTVDLLIGTSRPSSDSVAGQYDSNTVTGLSLGWQASEQIALGFTALYRDLEWKGGTAAVGNDEALTTTVDLTWELGTVAGGIKPFFGISAGATKLSTSPTDDQTALTAAAQAGLRFAVSDTVDFILGMRHFQIFDVEFTEGLLKKEEDIGGWEPYIGIRFKF